MIAFIIIELLIGLCALGGIYGAIHLIARRFFGSRHTMLAIEILTQRDAESAEVLIRDALFSVLTLRSGKVAVLTTEKLLEQEEFQKILGRYGVDVRVVVEKK